MIFDQKIHQSLSGEGQTPGLVFGHIVPCPLPPSDQGIEGRKEIKRNQHGTPLKQLAVIDVPLGGQSVLELPGGPDCRVVVRVAGPAGVCPARHGLPEARQAFRKAVKGGADPDVVDELKGALLSPNPERRKTSERPITKLAQMSDVRSWQGCCIATALLAADFSGDEAVEELGIEVSGLLREDFSCLHHRP